ncbi:hypothetical protein PHJA_002765000, partial [Phtheirospermum japonicum]
VWLLHFLANSVHLGLGIFIVDKGIGFDPIYTEDMGVKKVKKLVLGLFGSWSHLGSMFMTMWSSARCFAG